MLIAIGGVVVLAAIGIILAVVLKGGSSGSLTNIPAVGSLRNSLTGAAEVNALFKGIPQSGTTLGDPKAPVTMVEFVDAQCPYCQEFETQVFPGLVKDYVRPGKLRVQIEPWAFIGPDSVRGQAAEFAASEQNRLFNYAALLYFNQGEENTGWLNDSMVAAIAKSIPGLQVHALLNSRSSGSVKSAQKQVDALATADRISGTPTLFVGKTGSKGKEVDLTSPTDRQAVVAAIANATD